eukprot:1141536-Pelagomonas_calceolata.AAC.1
MQCMDAMHTCGIKVQALDPVHGCSVRIPCAWMQCGDAKHGCSARLQHKGAGFGSSAWMQCAGAVHGCSIKVQHMEPVHGCSIKVQHMEVHGCCATMQFLQIIDWQLQSWQSATPVQMQCACVRARALTQQQRAVWTDLEVKAHTAARTLRGLTRECTHMNALIRECTHT